MIIGISGGTGSGKTTVANKILEAVEASEVVFIQQDSYYRNLKDLPLDYQPTLIILMRSTTICWSTTFGSSRPANPSSYQSTISKTTHD
jgi:Ni2+-binding GTPase involved in maturation of urease and hydrogenase